MEDGCNDGTFPFSTRTDRIARGDKLRVLLPEQVMEKQEFVVYQFPYLMFENPKYTIPTNSKALFHAFINGGSRSYSSDGQVPAILAATEAQGIIQDVRVIARDPTHFMQELARKAIRKGRAEIEDWEVVRGTIGLVLGKWMPVDWQKKRFTDDIDFYWDAMDAKLFSHVLRKRGWTTIDKSPGNHSIWKKSLDEYPSVPLECSNDTSIGKSVGGVEPAVEGPGLKGIVKKKLTRCHDVDVSDVINIAVKGLLNIDEEEPLHPWHAVMEVLWRASVDDIAHLITVCQHAFAVAQYFRDVGNALRTHTPDFLSRKKFPDDKIQQLYMQQTPVVPSSTSYYWEPFKRRNASSVLEMRHELYNYFLRGSWTRTMYGSRLHTFALAVNWSLNKRLRPRKIKVFITRNPAIIDDDDAIA